MQPPASALASLGPAACDLLHRGLAEQASQGRGEAGRQAGGGAGRREVRVGGAALVSQVPGGRRQLNHFPRERPWLASDCALRRTRGAAAVVVRLPLAPGDPSFWGADVTDQTRSDVMGDPRTVPT
jgi:hypothetical protein